jgi:acetyl-CoA acetyltransferase
MRKIYVAGVGMTNFGFLSGMNVREIGEAAVWAALKNSGLKPSDIEVAYCGYAVSGRLYGQDLMIGQTCLREVGIQEIPILRVESACTSGGCAFREAYLAIQSGLYDVALAFGLEKMLGRPAEVVSSAISAGMDAELYGGFGQLPSSTAALMARRHMYEYGTTKEQLAMISVKNRKHGALNPKAQFRKEVTIEQILNAKMISDPLTLLMLCPATDGGAAAILVSEDFMKRRKIESPIRIAASILTSGRFSFDATLTDLEIVVRTAPKVYEMAGIGPGDIDVIETHDAFVALELCDYEDLGFCKKGEGGRFVESGAASLGGRIPFNPSGGLLSRGHPIGATALAQIVEIVEQLRGQSGPRQVEGAKVGLALCRGGYMMGNGSSLTMHVFER